MKEKNSNNSTDVLAVLDAGLFAAEKHRNQRRKGTAGEPYVNHLLEVARLVAVSPSGLDTNPVIAALLHDTIEDTASRDELVSRFGSDVADLVAEVTDDKSLPKADRKRLQIETAPKKSARAQTIKLARQDFEPAKHNLQPACGLGLPAEKRLLDVGQANCRWIHCAEHFLLNRSSKPRFKSLMTLLAKSGLCSQPNQAIRTDSITPNIMTKGLILVVHLPGYGDLTLSPRSVEWRPSGSWVKVHRASFGKFAAVLESNLPKSRAVRNPSGTPTASGSAAAKKAWKKIHANKRKALAAAKAGEPKPEEATPLQWRKAKAGRKKRS